MSNETITNADWKENAYKKHGREMLEILRENVVRLISNNDNKGLDKIQSFVMKD